MKTKILYHGNCSDGFCAAWIAWRNLGDKAEYFPVNYGDNNIPDIRGQDVILLDFCFEGPILESIVNSCKSILVIDHHKTAPENLHKFMMNPKMYVIFSTRKSGAKLALEYFFPDTANWLAEYVEDRDLWKWELPYSREVNAALQSYEFNFNLWNDILNKGREDYIIEGSAILRYQQKTIAEICKKVAGTIIDGHIVPSLNCTHLISEVGEKLCKGNPFSATYFIRNDGMVIWSLRSDNSGKDVSEIAKKLGGGGHVHAAGFQTPINFLVKQ